MSVVQWTQLYARLDAIEARLTALENRGDIVVPPDVDAIRGVVDELMALNHLDRNGMAVPLEGMVFDAEKQAYKRGPGRPRKVTNG